MIFKRKKLVWSRNERLQEQTEYRFAMASAICCANRFPHCVLICWNSTVAGTDVGAIKTSLERA